MAKLITMNQKENGQYVNLYPKTDWSQVNGADAQIASVNNSVDVKVANLQGQINQKQDASTAVNQGNFKNFVEQYTGEWVLLGQKNFTVNDQVVLSAGTSLKNIVAFKQICSLTKARGQRSGGTRNSELSVGALYFPLTVDMARDTYSTYGASNSVTSYYKVVSDIEVCNGTYTESSNNYAYSYARNIYYAPISSYGDIDRLYSIQVNPTTCQILQDINCLSVYAINPLEYAEGYVAVYGLKTTQGEFS